MSTIIDPEIVDQVFRDCLYADQETAGLEYGQAPTDAVVVQGIQWRYAFNPGRLKSHEAQVREWLALLPHQFRKGWTFLNACTQEDGRLWTGVHLRVEQLLCLGIGLGLAHWSIGDRSLWDALPGGMPYVQIHYALRPEELKLATRRKL